MTEQEIGITIKMIVKKSRHTIVAKNTQCHYDVIRLKTKLESSLKPNLLIEITELWSWDHYCVSLRLKFNWNDIPESEQLQIMWNWKSNDVISGALPIDAFTVKCMSFYSGCSVVVATHRDIQKKQMLSIFTSLMTVRAHTSLMTIRAFLLPPTLSWNLARWTYRAKAVDMDSNAGIGLHTIGIG